MRSSAAPFRRTTFRRWRRASWRRRRTASWPAFPMVDFQVTVYDGSYHDVDSSELSFKLAARKAFKNAMQEAKPALLEPIMNVEIQAPVEYAGDLMGDLNGRRGRISGHGYQGQHADHPRAGAHGGDAELSERSDVDDAGPGVVHAWSSTTTTSFRNCRPTRSSRQRRRLRPGRKKKRSSAADSVSADFLQGPLQTTQTDRLATALWRI